ncbi:Crp/Fnr family transcriptional regulator [Chitinophaga sp. GCM10012297]|uniref:Crp/Fnr family transcriptional regulator n=1 Tax=Chitinophaga chungangae TaxID=2821488 RepID=A0ABS3YA23_9BACT|nr:Crp/Fnr family transcriptional regulator [Chitinophaga chungangae]MBO9151527.1 Crp/Fnr family transcriptional regulator [Chitinophaga chungangae]
MPESTFNFFESYIRAYGLFSDDEIAIIKSLAIPKHLKKKQYLLRQGSVCRYHTFVCSGCLRSYRIDDEGCEHIIGLSPANYWVSDPVSLLGGSPSNDFIDALEDSTVIQLSTNSFKTLMENIPGFNEVNNKIIKDDYNVARDRIYMMLSLQAEERYRQFIRSFPNLHDRIPMYVIASYLGVSRETLTRIRSKMAET